ncbi:ATP-binding cassette domain-containing protein [Agromyces sp. NBRC 114283]|uniref:ATP-binding cassette domain-containing protein n=1 Tax=Agromyces sp. NBRC 114283 TaxID=2994521 RepID=UPI0024A472A3|nr:ATP-binding cassette domain-containing protein [Agromyces sp. NBRC 114283]GLU89705.1 ABC transporter ATP-binding protein [Agromyces sp. NBRC 114283]
MPTPILEARAIVKNYGHVRALDGASFTVNPGEVVGLIGDNGAGKSSLVKVLSGAVQPDSGELLVDGRPVTLGSPRDAQDAGIQTVYQDLALAPDLTPAANFFLGRELYASGIRGMLRMLDTKRMTTVAQEKFAELGVNLRSQSEPVSSLSGGQRQSVAIARAVAWSAKLVMLDEPTAALGVVQTARVLELISRVRDTGTAVVLISHNMPQVIDTCDRVEVLRLGKRVGAFRTADTTAEQLVAAMTGALSTEGDH